MPSVNQRGWTPDESNPIWQDEGYYDTVKVECDGLAKWWSQLHHEDEQESFARQRMYEDGDYEPSPYDGVERRFYDSEHEYIQEIEMIERQLKEIADEKATLRSMRQSQYDFIESRLQELGARMMRPYEHWNEDEAYMEYMERDR